MQMECGTARVSLSHCQSFVSEGSAMFSSGSPTCRKRLANVCRRSCQRKLPIPAARTASTNQCASPLMVTDDGQALCAIITGNRRDLCPHSKGSRRFDVSQQPRHIPAMPLFNRIFTSTLRFCALPYLDSLDAAGSYSPIAPGATMCRTGTLQF